MPERLVRKIAIGASLTLASIAGLTACSSDSAPDPTTQIDFEVEHVYTPDGQRVSTIATPIPTRVTAFCDGADFVELARLQTGPGISISRSVGHAACVDGRLSPFDFMLPPQ